MQKNIIEVYGSGKTGSSGFAMLEPLISFFTGAAMWGSQLLCSYATGGAPKSVAGGEILARN